MVRPLLVIWLSLSFIPFIIEVDPIIKLQRKILFVQIIIINILGSLPNVKALSTKYKISLFSNNLYLLIINY
jgi:hypothetical protein